MDFCCFYSLSPLPLNEVLVLRFIAYLHSIKFSPSSVRVHLAAIRAWAISLGLNPPDLYSARVKWALRSFTRSAPPPARVPPFTFRMLYSIYLVISYSYDNIMHFTAMLLAYFGCMRSAEYCPSQGTAPPLTLSSIRFIDSHNPYMIVNVPISKTALHGYTVVIGCSDSPICAYCWMLNYLHIRRAPPSAPLFLYRSGAPLTHSSLTQAMRQLLLASGLPYLPVTPHSLRAGAATDAHRAGAPDSAVQKLGRWASNAYRLYLRLSQADQALTSKWLASSHSHQFS